MKQKALLIILDGWGIGAADRGDVIYNTPTPYLDYLYATSPHSQLQASGEDVGLPQGQMGNSEVGHLNIGAGRIVYQDLVKINRACHDGTLAQHATLISALRHTQEQGRKVHFMGLLSNGGVHSSLQHLFALTDIAEQMGVERSYVHCFLDGRDTDPMSGIGFLHQLQAHCRGTHCHIADIVGRFYAMDRDHRWQRIRTAYDLLTGRDSTVEGISILTSDDPITAVQQYYDRGITDEFMLPIRQQGVDGAIEEGDMVVFYNFRNDRAKELTTVLTQQDMPEEQMMRIAGLRYFCMTPYDAAFHDVDVLFPKENVANTLAETLSRHSLRQLHTAETEKYAHVTFFLNGGREDAFPGEERVLVDSPKVATYDLQPTMSAPEVASRLVKALDSQKYDFAVVNFANGDMVGHTGVYYAIAKAVWCIDQCVRDVVEAARRNGYEVIIIADHGNADHAINADGTPNTAHSLNPVPFIYVTDNNSAHVDSGRLADVAPSLLHIMGLPQPDEMTGRCLIHDN